VAVDISPLVGRDLRHRIHPFHPAPVDTDLRAIRPAHTIVQISPSMNPERPPHPV
jgi:hypothetical protein